VNNALANLDLNLDSSATATATISVNYVDDQDPGAPVSVSLNNAITVRDLDYDLVYRGSRIYEMDQFVTPTHLGNTQELAENFVYTSNNSIEIYYVFDPSTKTWGRKDTYDITDIENVTLSTDTAGPFTPFANVYANYQGSTAATDRVLDNNVIKWIGPDDDENEFTGQIPWWGTQYARGETDGNKDSYWYLIPKRATQDDFTTNYSNTLGVDALEFRGASEQSHVVIDSLGAGEYEHTLSLWVKPNFSGSGVQEQYVIGGSLDPSSDGTHLIKLIYNDSGAGQIDVSGNYSGGSFSSLQTFRANNCITNNAWNHIMLARDLASPTNTNPLMAVNDSTVTLSITYSAPYFAPTSLNGAAPTAWDDRGRVLGVENIISITKTETDNFTGCLAELVAYNIFFDPSTVSNRRKFITAGGAPATINTSDTGITDYYSGGPESWINQLNPTGFVRINNVDHCPPNTLFQSNGSVVVGDFVGADGDCVYDTNASSGTYQQYTSSETGFNPPVSTIQRQTSFYRFGSPSNGTPTHTGADRDLTYYLTDYKITSPIYQYNAFSSEVRAQTSSTNLQLYQPTNLEGEFALSGDDTTERVAVAFNDNVQIAPNGDYSDLHISREYKEGRLLIMDTSNYGATPIKDIAPIEGTFKVNHRTVTLESDSPGFHTPRKPYWRSHSISGSKYWFYNNVIALIDNTGKLVIYKKN
jgi:hypothetical protein